MTNRVTKKTAATIVGVLVVAGTLLVIGLPRLLQGLGLHPDYTGQRFLLPEGRALIITTSHDRLGDGGDKTGVAASELTMPYYEFVDGRMKVEVASIKGGEIPIDPMTLGRMIRAPSDNRYLADPVLQKRVTNSLRIDDLDITQYAGRGARHLHHPHAPRA